jgi:hypothetical protein
LGVIPSAFAWVIASSGTWGSLWLWISCYSWWLPSPRWLGIVEEHWHELVIVLAISRWFVRGSWPFPSGEPKSTLVNCSCYWVTLTSGSFLRRPSVGLAWCQLAHEPPSVWSTQWGLACRQAREPREKNRVSHCLHWHSPGVHWYSYWLIDLSPRPVKSPYTLVFTLLVLLV